MAESVPRVKEALIALLRDNFCPVEGSREVSNGGTRRGECLYTICYIQ
jgi:hypothetical protein